MAISTKYSTTSLKTFDNAIVQTKLENQLTTALDMNQFITPDYSLTATPGMKVQIRKYVGNGEVEDLDMTEGNTNDIGATFTESEYAVTTTQGRVPYYDEQEMNDPTAVDKAVQHLSELLTNDLTTKIVGELNKATNIQYSTTFSFANFVDAISMLNVTETESPNMFCLISKEDYATVVRTLADDLKYVEDYVRTGYVGSVAGVPIIWSKAVTKGTAYIATKEAVTAYIKKGVETEIERDANTRKNTLYGRTVRVVALTDANKVVKMTTGSKPTGG